MVTKDSIKNFFYDWVLGFVVLVVMIAVLITCAVNIGELWNLYEDYDARSNPQNLENYRFWVNDGKTVKGLGDYSIVTDQETGIQYLMVGDDISPLYDKDGKPMQITE